jgi:hypothetical protein
MSLHPITATQNAHNAQEVLDDLRLALHDRAIRLPSLGVDAVTAAFPLYRVPLIELGCVNLATATALARALRYP